MTIISGTIWIHIEYTFYKGFEAQELLICSYAGKGIDRYNN